MKQRKIFVDTGAWFALQVIDDQHHPAAKVSFPKILAHYETLVTSNHVIGETYTLLRTSKGFQEAWRFLEILDRSPRIEQYFASAALERETYDLLQRYADHPFSFVDAVSFCIMQHEGIEHAFAFDAHFAIAGFIRIPLDLSI